VLRYWEGLSEAETAALMGVSVGTVKSQAHRAMKALRTSIELIDESVGEHVGSRRS
jgi:DNA-directed RNA polymerase specialized sigma24 family protein